jgi:uncharacterized protein (TIGR02284 family)
MTNTEREKLIELVKVLQDGVEFYREAKKHFSDSRNLTLFEKNANTRERIITELKPHVEVQTGDLQTSQSIKGKLKIFYTKILAQIKDADSTWIHQLEELEDRTLDEMDELMKEITTSEIKQLLSMQYLVLKECHAEMRQRETAAI